VQGTYFPKTDIIAVDRDIADGKGIEWHAIVRDLPVIGRRRKRQPLGCSRERRRLLGPDVALISSAGLIAAARRE
jgi:hypothetical protein